MMFQAPHLLSVDEGIAERRCRPEALRGWPEAEKRRARRIEALRLVELTGLSPMTSVQDLSGGQQQRVALGPVIGDGARAAAARRALLRTRRIYARSSLQRDVRSIAKKLGFNLIIVTHDIDEAILMADRALIMAGKRRARFMHRVRAFRCPIRASARIKEVQAMRSRLMDAFHSAAGKPSGADAHGEEASEPDSDSVTQHA
jgi:ABC-type nitrate/sulfonate/bicarbonate transport system ATPase subunit